MAERDEIVRYADELMDIRTFTDHCPNGLQVAGAREVTKLASSVSCTLDVFERAAATGAQMLLVHHPMFWRNEWPFVVDDAKRARLKVLFDADITLIGYHLPLDAHATYGNNARLREELELQRTDDTFAVLGDHAIGQVGEYARAVPFDEFVARVTKVVGRTPLQLGARPDVRRVAICSGGAASSLREAVALGADVLLTGEPAEPSHAEALEAGVSLIAAGHWATETLGPRALAGHLAEQFGLEHEFLAADNRV